MTAFWWIVGLIVLIAVARAIVVRARIPGAPATVRGAPELVVTTSPLEGIPAIRNFFRTSQTPVYFVSATAFNLLGIDRWVRTFRFINYYDSFDGWHPNVFVPHERGSFRERPTPPRPTQS